MDLNARASTALMIAGRNMLAFVRQRVPGIEETSEEFRKIERRFDAAFREMEKRIV